MKIGTFFWVKVRNIILLSILVSIIAFIVNSISDNWLLAKIVDIQQEQTIKKHTCNKQFQIENGVLTLKNFTFEVGDGSCITKLKSQSIKKLVIDDVYGGDTIETRVFAKYVKENNISALIKGSCNSSCVDLFLHSPDRSFCINSGGIGIHAYKTDTYDNNRFVDWLSVATQNAMLRAYNNTNINIDFIKKLYEETPSSELYVLNIDEIQKNNFAHRIITCK